MGSLFLSLCLGLLLHGRELLAFGSRSARQSCRLLSHSLLLCLQLFELGFGPVLGLGLDLMSGRKGETFVMSATGRGLRG